MMKLALALLVLTAASAPLSAQDPFTRATNAAKNARSAENAHIAAEQNASAAQKPASKSAAPAAAAQNKPAAASQQSKTAPNKAAAKPAPAPKAEEIPPVIMRESYEYSADGRRDPFVS